MSDKIQQIDQSSLEEATQLHALFQVSYQVEADLVGVKEFPPLKRKIEDFQGSKTRFIAYKRNDRLAAVVEIVYSKQLLEIWSMVVHPDFFRQGLAQKLLNYILLSLPSNETVVETAAVNRPAISLYEKLGFHITKQWTPSHGIEKVSMHRLSS